MNTLDFQGLKFPNPDLFRPAGVSLLYCSLSADGAERLCVGGVAWDSDRIVVAEVPGLKRLKCVYGDAVRSLWVAADLSLKSLRNHLGSQPGLERTVEAWRAPADGCLATAPALTTARSLELALASALVQHASLHSEPVREQANQVDERAASIGNARLSALVKAEVESMRPELLGRFSKRHRLAEGAREFRLGFAGDKLVANFVNLWPTSLSAAVRTAKSGIVDLLEARTLVERGLLPMRPVAFELIVHHPTSDDLQVTERGLANVRAAIAELTDVADGSQLRCRPIRGPSLIARHIVECEASNA